MRVPGLDCIATDNLIKTALSLMRLVPDPPGRIISGTVVLDGRDLTALLEEEMRDVRGNDISMIFQEPMTSLNPVMTIGTQIGEALVLHQKLSRKEALARAIDLLRLVGIPEPEQRCREQTPRLSERAPGHWVSPATCGSRPSGRIRASGVSCGRRPRGGRCRWRWRR